jgi:hypothetical protein
MTAVRRRARRGRRTGGLSPVAIGTTVAIRPIDGDVRHSPPTVRPRRRRKRRVGIRDFDAPRGYRPIEVVDSFLAKSKEIRLDNPAGATVE